MTRPSTRCAIISSSVSRTSWMRGSLLAAVFMPCLQNLAALRSDDSANRVQFVERESSACKFWLESVELARSHGFSAHELNAIRRIIRAQRGKILEAWHEHCG